MYYADKYCQFEKVYGKSLNDEDSYTITGNVIEFHKLTRDFLISGQVDELEENYL